MVKRIREVYEKNVKVAEQEREERQEQRKIFLYSIGSFLCNIFSLLLISDICSVLLRRSYLTIVCWTVLNILGLSISLVFFWLYKSDIALSVLKGILFSYMFLAFWFLLLYSYFGLWLLPTLVLFFLIKFFVSKIS
jgi:hypothetical protein